MPDPATSERTSNRAREIEVPPGARARTTLSRIDYANAILVEIGGANGWTGERWARAVLEDAPTTMRDAMTQVWSQLGILLGPERSDRHVLGWAVRRSTPDSVLLGAGSPGGLQVEMLVERGPSTLLFASFIQQDSEEARAQWAEVESLHTPVMCQLIDEAVARSTS